MKLFYFLSSRSNIANFNSVISCFKDEKSSSDPADESLKLKYLCTNCDKRAG